MRSSHTTIQLTGNVNESLDKMINNRLIKLEAEVRELQFSTNNAHSYSKPRPHKGHSFEDTSYTVYTHQSPYSFPPIKNPVCNTITFKRITIVLKYIFFNLEKYFNIFKCCNSR
jgi:hypothetical protein